MRAPLSPHSPDSHEVGEGHGGLQERIPRYEQYSPSRRTFLRAIALVCGVELGSQILGSSALGNLRVDASPHVTGDTEEPEQEGDLEQVVQRDAEKLVQEFERDHPESAHMSERERGLLLVDYAGLALFGRGVYSLSRGKSIGAQHYALLGALTGMKYVLSDDHGKKHLKAETQSSVKALGIISGTIIGAEGLHADVVQAYEHVKKQKPAAEDRVALLAMLSSCISPLATTVGSATILKNVSQDLCKIEGEYDENGRQKYDEKMMAVCVSHVSNLSGYVLFGDPPFIAMVEKYGFMRAITWQLQACLPLLAHSLFSSSYKLNKALVTREGLTGDDATREARQRTVRGLKNNIGFVYAFIMRSIRNAGAYFGQRPQDIGGIQVWVGENLADTIRNIAALPFSEEFDKPSEVSEGVAHGEAGRRVSHVRDAMFEMTRDIDAHLQETRPTDDAASRASVERMHRLREAIDAGDHDATEAILREMGIDSSVRLSILNRLRDVDDDMRLNQSGPEKKRRTNPLSNTFDTDRIKEALGHNLGDVVNVFPFQAGCVPFLETVFMHAKKGVEQGIRAMNIDPDTAYGSAMLECAMFFLIKYFSNVADNYVGCKIGLQIFPQKPQIALIASIQGGSETAIGNMANVAQFDLQKFGLHASFANWRQHLDTKAIGLAYSLALGQAQRHFGFMKAPEVRAKDIHANDSEHGH